MLTSAAMTLARELTEALAAHGFKDAPGNTEGVDLLLKRQNFNTNRAVVLASLADTPQDFGMYIRLLRERVAKRCGFLPILWPIGIQVIVSAPGAVAIDPAPYLALVDNQWALIQSVFLIDPERGQYREARTWGQFITGKFQDAIGAVLQRHFSRVPAATRSGYDRER